MSTELCGHVDNNFSNAYFVTRDASGVYQILVKHRKHTNNLAKLQQVTAVVTADQLTVTYDWCHEVGSTVTADKVCGRKTYIELPAGVTKLVVVINDYCGAHTQDIRVQQDEDNWCAVAIGALCHA